MMTAKKQVSECKELLRHLEAASRSTSKMHGWSVDKLQFPNVGFVGDDCRSHGKTPVMIAAASGDAAAVAHLLDLGYSATASDKSGSGLTALEYAARNGNESIVKLLLANGADPGAVDSSGVAPLHKAVSFGHPRIVALMLDHQNSRSSRIDHNNQPSILHLNRAAVNPNLKTTAPKLSRHATHPGSNIEQSPLHLAVFSGSSFATAGDASHCYNARQENVELLLAAGADPNLADQNGDTPLILAARNGDLATLARLRRAGGDVDAIANHRGETARSTLSYSLNTAPGAWLDGDDSFSRTAASISHAAMSHVALSAPTWALPVLEMVLPGRTW